MHKVAIICVFGLLLASQASAQNCYSCASCGDDPFSTSSGTVVACSTSCYKIKASATLLGVTTTTVSRGCALTAATAGCTSGGASAGSLAGGSGTTCYCSGDKCNTGAVSAASVAALGLSAAAALMLR